MKIKIEDWYDLHKGFELELHPGVTCLVGPNGAGKTTLLTQLKEYAKANDIPMWQYSNFADGPHEDYWYLETGKTEMFATAAFSSEGEKVALHFAGRVGKMGNAIQKASVEGKPIFVFLDALDSGASIDRARDVLELFKTIDSDIRSGTEAYILCAVNQYELTKPPVRCVDCRTGKEVSFKNYEDYAEFICTYFEKHKRRKEVR